MKLIKNMWNNFKKIFQKKQPLMPEAGHKELNLWAEEYGIRRQFHFWTTKNTKRNLINKVIRRSYQSTTGFNGNET